MLMFTRKTFDIFSIESLDDRMHAIRNDVQPIFQELDEYFKQHLENEIHEELFIHIAQHRRRSVHPPESTWSALSTKKRGYKMQPHFQLGMNSQYIFMWLSYIDQPKNEQKMAETLLNSPELFQSLSEDFVLSKDHTVKAIEQLTDHSLTSTLTRWRDVKKGEFQIGRILSKDDTLLDSPLASRQFMLDTYLQLIPIYQATLPLSQ